MEEESGNAIMRKVRNVIRSLLQVGEEKSPSLTRLIRSLLSTFEGITGVKLLPPPEKKKKKKSKKTKPKSSSSSSKSTKETKKSITIKSAAAKAVAPTKATQKHLSENLSNKHANYRIQRELKEFIKSPPPNLAVKVGSNIRIWIITVTGAEGTVYEGETYKLRVQFPAAYPTVPPSVYFLPPPPKHEHVYTNGDICLSLLGEGWRPTMTAQSIAVSILSILSSATKKSLPMDNARHSQNKPGQYQKDWVYHDDNC